jgi:hypothetical protein
MRKIPKVLPWVALCGLISACGPTVVSSVTSSQLNDPPASVEIREVQPDALSDWTTQELWGVNRSGEPVCAGYRSTGMSWSSFVVPPHSEIRLLGLGNGDISGETGIASLRGRVCSDALMASIPAN